MLSLDPSIRIRKESHRALRRPIAVLTHVRYGDENGSLKMDRDVYFSEYRSDREFVMGPC